MNWKILLSLPILSLLIGCGGGSGGSSTTASSTNSSVGLPVALAQGNAQASNGAMINSIQRVSSFAGVVPQASKSKVVNVKNQYLDLLKKSLFQGSSQKSSSKAVSKAISESNGVYTISESNSSQGYDINLTLRYYDAQSNLLTGANVVNAKRINANLSGYETVDNIKLTYSSFTLNRVDNGNTTSTISGNASISGSNNTTFALNMNNLLVSNTTALITSGSIEMSGADTTNVVTVTSTFQNNGTPIVTVKENSQQYSSQSLALPSITVNNGQTTFNSNSSMITHPFIGDTLSGNANVFDTSISGGGLSFTGTATINKTNTIVKVCNVNTRKFYIGLVVNGVTDITEVYIAQDSLGNLYGFGDSQAAQTNCSVIPLDMPVNMTQANFSWTGTNSYKDTFTSTITNVGMTKDGFTNLTEITTNTSDGTTSKEYFNTTYGSAIYEGSGLIDGTLVNIVIKRKP
ncbi:MAG: hypothetical protein KC646_07170 [Candidatus Cloacimonetes bacterium]|nr:hypothetical protein [Candidatus Cloacimonadota bacterium]